MRPKWYQPTQLSAIERATKVKVSESIGEGKGFPVVGLEEISSSKWWVEGKL